jgi:dTDP-4-amino-4,6-dideoxygalactose transaminase
MRIGRTIPPAASPIYWRDILNGFKGLLRGRREVERFGAELKEYFGVNHVFLVSSGKAALTLILKALHELHPQRDEVLIPAFCCYSVPSAIMRAGLKIRLCDVNPDTLDFDHIQLENILKKDTTDNEQQTTDQLNSEANNQQRTIDNRRHQLKPLLAVLGAHLFGLRSDMERIRELVADSTVKVVEDAAQVMGFEQNGQKLGTIGDVSFFSLGRSKSISAVEGGIILTRDNEISQQISKQLEDISGYSFIEKVKLLFQAVALTIFQRPSFFWLPKSLPFLRVGDTIYDPTFKIRRLSGLQAGLAKNWKVKLSEYSKPKHASATRWSSIFDTRAISVYASRNGEQPSFTRYPIRLQNIKTWKRLLKQSEKHGLGIQLTYPDSINGICELAAQFASKDFPAARKLVREILTLPVHPLLAKKDIAKIESYIKFLLN